MEFEHFENIYFLRLDKDEEIVSCVKDFCEKRNIKLGIVNGLGSLKEVKLGFFNPVEKKYYAKDFTKYYEMASLAGTITQQDNKPYAHLHAVIADSECKTFGGHLTHAVVSLTCEITIEQIQGNVGRVFDESTGLNIFKFN